MSIGAVLFDLDDTLIDHSYATIAATRATIALDICGASAAGIRCVWLNRFQRVRGSAPDAAEVCGFDDLDAVVAALLEPTGRR